MEWRYPYLLESLRNRRPLQCPPVHLKSHMQWPGIKPEPPWSEGGSNTLRHERPDSTVPRIEPSGCTLLTYLLTYSMEQSHSWEANRVCS